MRVALFLALGAIVVLLWPSDARAHGMRSVYVEITEIAPGSARVTLRSQLPVSGVRLAADAPCAIDAERLSCPETLDGARVRAEGLGAIAGEAVVFLARMNGSTTTHLLTPAAPELAIDAHRSWPKVAAEYVRLGVVHIATGADHLLFLLALVLSLRRVRAVLVAETAFTLSHTISFSAASLGLVHVSPLAAEACIALSLVLVALDIGKDDVAADAKRGAALAFVFGLVHGLGFAGGLAEIGLPDRAIPAALAGFATGVEIGQVVFLAIVLLLLAAVRRARFDKPLTLALAYAIGAVGCFWLLERGRALFA